MNESVTGRTKLIGLIGNPIEHTISPQLHNTLSDMLGIDSVYIPIKVDKDKTGDMASGFRASNFLGFNVTIPFKVEILKYVDEVSDDVKLMGCANTVKIKDGRLFAYNTDAEGFARAFMKDTGVGFEGKKVVILGAGGTCRSLAVKILRNGAKGLHIVNRSVEKAQAIAGILNDNLAPVCKAVDLFDKKELHEIIAECDIIVNTTSVGLHPDTELSPIPDDLVLDERVVVYDVIYNPFRTKLLRQAEAFGCRTANGLGMLFYQGVLAYELWMDLKVPQSILEKLYVEFSNYLLK